jgi:SAM-dependent methyltransferase
VKNPWQNISADDYEGHMKAVGQSQLLNSVFKHYFDLYQPKNIIVPGATTGNGLENIDQEIYSIIAIDINEDYLQKLKSRLPSLANLNTVCGDIQTLVLNNPAADFIYAALIFEYVDVEKTIANIKKWIKPAGRLVTVLQIPNKKLSAVSATKFTSLNQLGGIMKLVDIGYFEEIMAKNNLRKEESKVIELESGKQFYVCVHVK